ncbi:MAG: aspartate kinase [Chitinispirillia bacterium]|jgi:aspartate kinase
MRKRNISVEKIGGTSMSQFKEVLRNIILNKKGRQTLYNRIFVVSAYSNVTNMLLENKKNGKPGIYSEFVSTNSYNKKLDSLLKYLISLNKSLESIGLDLKKANEFIIDRIDQTRNNLQNISELITSGYVDRSNIYLSAREILASIGEAHSAFNSANIVCNNGLNAIFLDLSGYHDSEYLTIDQRIEKSFYNIDFSKVVPIATGYTKGTEGIMRKFDRGYTEVTFAKIALCLNAEEAIIHKEYHFCTADPKIVGEKNVSPVCYTNYDVADQLADIWMEAVHPAVSKMLEFAKINLRIKNSFDPNHPGTLISKDYKCKESKVEIISGNDKVIVIEIHDPAMVGAVGFDKSIMDIFEKHNTSYLLKATNANSISIVIRKLNYKELINELKNTFYKVSVKDAAIICVLGSNIALPGILAKVAQALADNDINIECVSQSMRQVNIQFVVKVKDYIMAIKAINERINS